MDIGKQDRVIIVEPLREPVLPEPTPTPVPEKEPARTS